MSIKKTTQIKEEVPDIKIKTLLDDWKKILDKQLSITDRTIQALFKDNLNTQTKIKQSEYYNHDNNQLGLKQNE